MAVATAAAAAAAERQRTVEEQPASQRYTETGTKGEGKNESYSPSLEAARLDVTPGFKGKIKKALFWTRVSECIYLGEISLVDATAGEVRFLLVLCEAIRDGYLWPRLFDAGQNGASGLGVLSRRLRAPMTLQQGS